MLVGDEDEAGRGQALVPRGAAHGIVVDDHPRQRHHEGGVLDRVDEDLAALDRIAVAAAASCARPAPAARPPIAAAPSTIVCLRVIRIVPSLGYGC